MQELHWVKIFQLKIVCVFLLEKKTQTIWNGFSVRFLMESYFVGGKGD